VTTTTNVLIGRSRGLIEAVRHTPRNEFFVGLFILGCVNGLLGRTILTLNLQGWMGAMLGFDMNVIVLFACFAGLYLIASSSADQVRTSDVVIGFVFLGLVILPIYAMSWVAVAGLSLYILSFASPGSELRRGALILLALTIPMLWSRLFFQFFARPLLELDATMVTWLLGTGRIGNLVNFADNSGYMVITPACASWANLSFAFLCWVAVTQWANHRWSYLDLLWSFLACVSVVAVNVTRIAIIGLSRGHYETIHGQWGDAFAGTIILCLTIGFSLIAARRELFSRA
jgi:hypothetical protein